MQPSYPTGGRLPANAFAVDARQPSGGPRHLSARIGSRGDVKGPSNGMIVIYCARCYTNDRSECQMLITPDAHRCTRLCMGNMVALARALSRPHGR